MTRLFLAVLFVFMAALQIRFTALTVDVLSSPASFPAIPSISTTTLAYDTPGMASKAAGIKEGDILLAVNGQPVRSRAGEARLFFQHKPGDTIALTLRRGQSAPFTTNYVVVNVLRISRSSALMLVILNIVTPWSCILLGFLVAFRRPGEEVTWPLLLLLICVSQAFRGYGDPPYAWGIIFSWSALFFDLFALPGMAAAWLWVSIQFPDPHSPNRVWPWARWVFGMPLIVMYGLIAVWFATAIHSPQALPWLVPLAEAPRWVLEVWGSAIIVLGCINLAVKLKRETNRSMRRRLRWAVPGLVVGILPAPAGLVFTNGDLDRLPLPVLGLCLVSPFLIPLTLAYALLVNRMFDIGVVLRQGLLASRTVSFIRTALVAAFLYLAVFVLSQNVPGITRVGEMAGCAAAIAVTLYGADWLRNAVDRRFFQEAVNSERLLMELSSEVRGIRDAGDLLRTVTDRVANAMHVSHVVAMLPDKHDFVPAYAVGNSDGLAIALDDPAISAMRASRRPTSQLENLLVPISTGVDLRHSKARTKEI